MKIVFASGNKHKIEEFQAILRKYLPEIEVVSMKDAGVFDDIDENGDTFMANANIKAQAVASHGFIGVGDDSGLVVDALGGAPGIYSARYAGEHGNDAKNNEKLLKVMQDVEDRGAAFVCAIACAFPKNMPACKDFCVIGECKGEILHGLKGDGGFGYDPLFYVPKFDKTFGELAPEEKNEISHRAVATEIFAREFCRALGENNE